ncbi:MAG: 50S ribosomal protein L11 methyltransferase [Eubacteriales bacterium]
MTYHEIKLIPKNIDINSLADALTAIGFDAFELSDGGLPEPGGWDYIDEDLVTKSDEAPFIRIYLENSPSFPEQYVKLKRAVFEWADSDEAVIFEESRRDDSEWKDVWKTYFKPFKAGTHIVICPKWEEYSAAPDDIVVTIDPGAAFGSGLHETTKMCIAALEKHVSPGATVLDVGCGSGILGISATKLGAKRVWALDYDPASVSAAKENAGYNHVDMTVLQSDLLASAPRVKADVIVANIVADIIIELNKTVKDYLTENGIYIVSGIIAERLNDVVESLENHEFEVLNIDKMGEWRAITVSPKNI